MGITFEVEIPPASPKKNESSNPEKNETQTKTWTVSEFTRSVRMCLEKQFRSVLLEGEISNFKRAASGHLYFVLKDSEAQIKAVMFRNVAQNIKFEVEDGLEVLVKAHLSVYAPRGEYQLNITSLDPKGVGALQLAFEQLKEKLSKEGLFADEHKQPIPFLPRRIGIITSPTGAVIHDMHNVLNRRFPGIPTLLFPAAVQGELAPKELVNGIQYMNTLQESQQIDVLIVGRGGGSLEDLWAYNDENVARAIFNSQIPIISAVGHETDFSISDYVADLRAPTPSAAMELAVPNKKDLLYTVDDLTLRLETRIKNIISESKHKIETISKLISNPSNIITQYIQRVDDLYSVLNARFSSVMTTYSQNVINLHQQLMLLTPLKLLPLQLKQLEQLESRLFNEIKSKLTSCSERVEQRQELLESLSPLSIMKRGYGVVFDQTEKLVCSVNSVSKNDKIWLNLHDGRIKAKVEETKNFK